MAHYVCLTCTAFSYSTTGGDTMVNARNHTIDNRNHNVQTYDLKGR